jgi:hypothetical protein
VLAGQAEDPLRCAQPEQGIDLEQAADHRDARRADVGGLAAAPDRSPHLERDLLISYVESDRQEDDLLAV